MDPEHCQKPLNTYTEPHKTALEYGVPFRAVSFQRAKHMSGAPVSLCHQPTNQAHHQLTNVWSLRVPSSRPEGIYPLIYCE